MTQTNVKIRIPRRKIKKKKKLKEPNRCSRFEKYNIRNKFTGYI